jgi:two-component sensor histidine kinase
MSLAAVQQQLARSQDKHVEVCSYFRQLCKSLSASMITDSEKLSIIIEAEESFLPSDTATSLGLIITELVINCLKHAFPKNEGQITVTFDSQDDAWTLVVEDDGVGMPTGSDKATPGLGTALIEALAQKLDAQIVVTGAKSGTRVLLTHRSVAMQVAGAQEPQRAV